MTAIAEGRVFGVFAGTQKLGFGFFCGKFERLIRSAFMAAIAKRLSLTAATFTPKIGFTGF